MNTKKLHSSTFDEYRYPASRSCRLHAVDPQEWRTIVHNTSMLLAMTKTRAPSLCDKIFRALRYTFQTSHILTLLVQSEMFLSFCLVGDPNRGRSSSLMYCRRAEVLLRRSWSTHCSLAKAVNHRISLSFPFSIPPLLIFRFHDKLQGCTHPMSIVLLQLMVARS